MAAFLDDLMSGLNSDQGLLGLAMMAAAAPKERRTTIPEGLLSGMSLVNQRRLQREEQAMREKEMRMREQDFGLRQRMSGLQEQQILQALEAQKRAQERDQQRQRYLGSVDPMQGPAMPVSMAGGMAAGLSPQEAAALMPPPPKEKKPLILKPGEVAFDDGGTQLFSVPEKADKAPEALRTLALIYGEGSPEYMNAVRALAQKMTTHQPGVSVSYGAPMAGTGPDGKPVFFAPPKDPTKPPVILSGVTPANADKPTEDQSKAAGWLTQAENAYKNMLSSGFDKKGAPTPSAYPGPADLLERVPVIGGAANMLRTADRQKFIQASSSLSEALLRAATGAGVNMDEAKQKIQELTPVFGENPATTKQKMDAIPLYIQSLKIRAGAAGTKIQQQTANDDPLGLRK